MNTNPKPTPFPLSTQQLHLAIEGLAQAGTSARAIAAAVEADTSTVCEALILAGIEPIVPSRTFRFENIDWDTDGESIERLPREGTITVEDCTQLEDDEVEYKTLNDFSDLHGYCIESCNATEVPGARWPTTPREADELVKSASWTGELRMGGGRYALVTHETTMLRYPEHLAHYKRVMGNAYREDWGGWKFLVIDTQNAKGMGAVTSKIVDLIPLALKFFEQGGEESSEVFAEMLIAMGLKHLQAPEAGNVCRIFQLKDIKWVGKWKKTRHLPTSGEVHLIEFEDNQTDNESVEKDVVSAFAEGHRGIIQSYEVVEVFHV